MTPRSQITRFLPGPPIPVTLRSDTYRSRLILACPGISAARNKLRCFDGEAAFECSFFPASILCSCFLRPALEMGLDDRKYR